MSPLAIALLVFVGSFATAALGVALRLPHHHLDEDSRDVVKSVMGLVATLTALVLGLLIASAQDANRTLSNQLGEMAADLVELDQTLGHYGPEAAPARALLHRAVRAEIERVWPQGKARAESMEPAGIRQERGQLLSIIGQLSPRSEAQRYTQQRAMQLVAAFARMRTLLVSQAKNELPGPFLAVLVFWVAVLFFGFGLFARFNTTVLLALSVGALSVAGAMYLILELNRPIDGLMRVSEVPLRYALSQMRE
jgi:Protein of unknown function (DUF4239)